MINGRENNYSNGAPTCSFCNQYGHSMAVCPEMKKVYEEQKDLPIDKRGYKANFAVQYFERKNSKKRKSTKATKKCGYCREVGHNRKDCSRMEADKRLLIRGNQIWRRVYADNASRYGLTPASVLKVTTREYSYTNGGYENKSTICTVGAELPDNLTVFALGDDGRQQHVRVPLIGYNQRYGDGKVNVKALLEIQNNPLASSLFISHYGWTGINTLEVVVGSTYQFPDGWVDQIPDEDIKYAFKKWNRSQMERFLKKIENLVDTYGGDYEI